MAAYGHDDLPRLLHRITVAGDITPGIGGDTSAVRKDNASSYYSLEAA